jgi:hypothetical protein
MQQASLRKPKTRFNLVVPSELTKKAAETAEKHGQTVSEFVRIAIASYIATLEKEALERELADGYKANASYYAKMSKEWEAADAE